MIAFLAFIVSVLSLESSYKAVRLSRIQEDRRKPRLVATLLASYADIHSDSIARI